MSYVPTPVEEAIYGWLAEAVPDVTVIYAHQAAPRPDTPFVTLLVVREDEDGHAGVRLTDTPLEGDYAEEIERHLTVSVSVQTFGAQAYATLRRILDSSDSAQQAQRNAQRHLAVRDTGTPQRVPEQLDTRYEDRWRATITCGLATRAALPGEGLEQIEATHTDHGTITVP